MTPWLTVTQTVERYGVPRSTVWNWLRRNRVSSRLEHDLRWIDPDSVDRYLATRRPDQEAA